AVNLDSQYQFQCDNENYKCACHSERLHINSNEIQDFGSEKQKRNHDKPRNYCCLFRLNKTYTATDVYQNGNAAQYVNYRKQHGKTSSDFFYGDFGEKFSHDIENFCKGITSSLIKPHEMGTNEFDL